jgi:flagellar motor switch protein FliN/FliY
MWTLMNDGLLSQQEIDVLLRSGNKNENKTELTESEIDVLGEVGNISMATAATALSQILNQKVQITTPKVQITTLDEVQKSMTIPNMVLQVKFLKGLEGANVLLIGVPDASIIASLMMGGDGKNPKTDLSEMEISAVSEAMNQMIGSASTSLATILSRSIDISPPSTQIWDSSTDIEVEGLEFNQPIVRVGFRMTVEDLIDSEIMQIFSLKTVKQITDCLLGESTEAPVKTEPSSPPVSPEANLAKEIMEQPQPQQVSVQKPIFGEIQDSSIQANPQNIDLIMDVPLEFSVLLGRTKRTIRQVLSLSPGSVVELDKLAEEPLEVYVNGKLIAHGEVVVINENFGIRITNIISATERVKNLK